MPTRSYSTREEVERAGELIFRNFANQQLENNNIQASEIDSIELNQNAQFMEMNYTIFQDIGHNLLQIAQQFENSRERTQIRNRANQVHLRNIQQTHFNALLDSLFSQGFSRERIVVLFYFCTDLALSAYISNSINECGKLLSWSMQYIKDKVCDYIISKGGWVAVFKTHRGSLTVAVIGFAACFAAWYSSQ